MSYSIILIAIGFLSILPATALAQTLQGQIKDRENEPLQGATVAWLNSTIGTYTNGKGEFSISTKGISDRRLVIKSVGYLTDTLIVISDTFLVHTLKETSLSQEVTITANAPDMYVAPRETVKTEVITARQLTKAACCDLAGCFEGNASIQPTTTNVVTNSQELRILGLSGIYNQTLFDGMPLFQGLSSTYGISSIPGVLVDNIFVAKGATSVLQGYESISGQINVEPKEPPQPDRYFLNGYVNSYLEKHLNGLLWTPLGKETEWNNYVVVHAVQPALKIDKDVDNFLDLPLLSRYLIYDKLKYGDQSEEGWNARIGFMYLDEQRIGGQPQYDPETMLGSSTVYGQKVHIKQPTAYSKMGYRFDEASAIAISASAFHQSQESWFGQTKYDAGQTSLYSNIQYELLWDDMHNFKTGLSYRHLNLDENISFTDNPLQKTFDGHYLKTESIPGIFAENIFNWDDYTYQLITGIRLDYHNMFGSYVTPRAMAKIQLGEETILRASAGTGWRTANIFSENIGLLSSQRDVIFQEQLQPERAVNLSLNVMHTFDLDDVVATLSFDAHRINFQNQIFPNYDTVGKAVIANFTGVSASNGIQVDLDVTAYEVLTTKLSYNFLDAFREVENRKVTLPFNPLHRLLGVISLKPVDESWHADVTINWYGEQLLPRNSASSIADSRSKPYGIVKAQFTKAWDIIELYAGCENIFDYRQSQPIVSWQNPFSAEFDTSSNWGPTRGREFYIGFRFAAE